MSEEVIESPLHPSYRSHGSATSVAQERSDTTVPHAGAERRGCLLYTSPQIGLSLQLAVIEDREELLKDLPPREVADKDRRPLPFHVIINPQITLTGGDQAYFYEGCLSLAGFSAVVPRARAVRVEYLDEQGEPRSVEASGWYARILQHEIDHLDGTLYLDRMYTRTFTSIDNWNRFWQGKPIGEPSSR